MSLIFFCYILYLGHLTCELIRNMTYNVSRGTLNHSVLTLCDPVTCDNMPVVDGICGDAMGATYYILKTKFLPTVWPYDGHCMQVYIVFQT